MNALPIYQTIILLGFLFTLQKYYHILSLFIFISLSTNSQTKDSVDRQIDSTINSAESKTKSKNQNKDLKPPNNSINIKTLAGKPEILTSGFIDIVNNGQVNASVRFIRLFIGEPGKFAIPLSIYSGVSSNNFSNGSLSGQNQQNQLLYRSNDQLVINFINPLSGLANLSIEGIIFFSKKKITRTGIIYHFGERILTGQKTGTVNNPGTGKPVNFLNSFGATGLYFQTGAWERNNAKNVGIFWLVFRYIGCYTNPNQLKEFLPAIETNGLYHGWSVGWGVEINQLVNIKVLYYKYIKQPEIDYSLPIYQFSFNYSLKN
jgi:hypothetical protein